MATPKTIYGELSVSANCGRSARLANQRVAGLKKNSQLADAGPGKIAKVGIIQYQ